MIDKQQVKQHFSNHAATYDQYAKVQRQMADQLLAQTMEHMISTKHTMKILEIGCGTGYLTQKLSDAFPNAQIHALDIAPGMIAWTKTNLPLPNVTYQCADIEETILAEKYDLILSNATFQWFNHLSETLSRLNQGLNPHGILSFTTFGQNTFKELAHCYQLANEHFQISPPITCSQDFFTSEDLNQLCQRQLSPLANSTLNEQEFLQHYDSPLRFLQSIKRTGATNSNADRRVPDPGFLKKVMEFYTMYYTETNIKSDSDQDVDVDPNSDSNLHSDFISGSGFVRATYHGLLWLGRKDL